MGFTFVAADWFRLRSCFPVGASRHSSETKPFDRVSSNSVEQTFTAVVDVFIGAHLKTAFSRRKRRQQRTEEEQDDEIVLVQNISPGG
jgi:hypothetical protein